MKFGKRLANAVAGHSEGYVDYKALKQAVKQNCISGDHTGSIFRDVLCRQLRKVDELFKFRLARVQQEVDRVARLPYNHHRVALEELWVEIRQLIDISILNYVGVVKSVKKRNKVFEESFPGMVVTEQPSRILENYSFCGNDDLIKIIERVAELKKSDMRRRHERISYSHRCHICVQPLTFVITLACNHDFCWSCVMLYCLRMVLTKQSSKGVNHRHTLHTARFSQFHLGWASSQSSQAFSCSICRHMEPLDLDGLTSDANLTDFFGDHAYRSYVANMDIAEAADVAADGDSSMPSTVSSSHSTTYPLSVQSVSASSSAGSYPSSSARATAPVAIPCPQGSLASESPKGSVGSHRSSPGSAFQQPPAFAQAVKQKEDLLKPKELGMPQLTIVLDLDGTLISSFPPRSAPLLPPHMKTHTVGQESRLNPQGVFVVERPGLREFLKEASRIGELVVFTAGLPEYAEPIIRAIDPDRTFFGDRIICRGGTDVTKEYQCVKNLVRLQRPLEKTVIVDDTPLAFLWHPQNGIPVLGFRGDPDDTLLMDAVLPLLKEVDAVSDVRQLIDERFEMAAWFKSKGYDSSGGSDHESLSLDSASSISSVVNLVPVRYSHINSKEMVQVDESVARCLASIPHRNPAVLVMDVDYALLEGRVLDMLVERTAVEILPNLCVVEAPEDNVRYTNNMLDDLNRRGVEQAMMRAVLQRMGKGELHTCVVAALQKARKVSVAVRLLTNGNQLFVKEILEGAGIQSLVNDVHGNVATLEYGEQDVQRGGRDGQSKSMKRTATRGPPSKVVVHPCQDASCKMCPASLCKGMHVMAMAKYHSRVNYVASTANDVCAVLSLRSTDTAMVKQGSTCHEMLEARVDQPHQPMCRVLKWDGPEQLAQLIANVALR